MALYLYRGANAGMHEHNAGRLVPNRISAPFRDWTLWGSGHFWGGGTLWGNSLPNAVHNQQLDSGRYPTSGVSTTPAIEAARRYATHDGKHPLGYVYKIDASLLAQYKVTPYVVAEHVKWPAKSEDMEVILVADDFGILPAEIVVDLICVHAEAFCRAG